TTRCRRLATRSISPSGLRHRRARMRNPLAIKNAAARLSAEIPTRKAASRSGRGSRLIGGGGRSLCDILAILGENKRALINLASRSPGRNRDLADRVLDRNAGYCALE